MVRLILDEIVVEEQNPPCTEVILNKQNRKYRKFLKAIKKEQCVSSEAVLECCCIFETTQCLCCNGITDATYKCIHCGFEFKVTNDIAMNKFKLKVTNTSWFNLYRDANEMLSIENRKLKREVDNLDKQILELKKEMS